MDRPTLSVQTVYLSKADENDARTLGKQLYELLTRPAEDALSQGAGIPVRCGVSELNVDPNGADKVVLLPVLGKSSFHIERKSVINKLLALRGMVPTDQILIVPTTTLWKDYEEQLPGARMLSVLTADSKLKYAIFDEIVSAITGIVDPDLAEVRLFISHAEQDLVATGEAAQLIFTYGSVDERTRKFFKAVELQPGESLKKQLDRAENRGVLLAVRGDSFSARVGCQNRLLAAKLQGLPTLTVEVLKRGERRSSPYSGNCPSIVWNGDARTVVSCAMVEWLRTIHFRREAQRVAKAAGLPADIMILARPPELLDLAQGPLQSVRAQLVLHPDPELPVIERRVLKAARPRLQLVTPTTAFRSLLNRAEAMATVASPLQGTQVAMSLSDSLDIDSPEGFTSDHMRDATVYIARSLISVGASIAYGGDFRKSGYTELLAELIAAYDQTSAAAADLLHSYLPATVPSEEVPDDLPLTAHSMSVSDDMKSAAIVPPPSEVEIHSLGIYLSDMRRLMAEKTSARIILGGASRPRGDAGEPGYLGRHPGIVEEAWRTMEAGKPLYVVGGFGGAAGLVATLLEHRTIPDQLRDKTWSASKRFLEIANSIDNDPYHDELHLRKRLEDLAQAILDLGGKVLADGASSTAWNGLTLEENLELFSSRDPVCIASLILTGLLKVARIQAQGKLEIELVLGSVTNATGLDAIAVAAFDKVALGGAGGALDYAIGGRASVERSEGRSLVSMAAADVDADWLYIASLGPLANLDGLEQRIEQAARDTAEHALRHGFWRLGVVAFGGATLTNVAQVTDAMLRGFRELNERVVLTWFESDAERFNSLQNSLALHEDVKLTTRRGSGQMPARVDQEEKLFIYVTLVKDELSVTVLPPAGSAIASSQSVKLLPADLDKFAKGVGAQGRATPDIDTLKTRGIQLAEIVFGTDAKEILSRCSKNKIVIIHDTASSKLPFEIMRVSDDALCPSKKPGLSRRLAVTGVPTERLFSRPPRIGKLKVLLVVDPTETLEGAAAEADAVMNILAQYQDRVEKPRKLAGKGVSKATFLEELSRCDVFHYCGHATFNAADIGQSGLVFGADEMVALEDLVGLDSLPRIAIVNACEAGRVRGTFTTEAAAFAEWFLRSGVEAYLGTFWRVGDQAAGKFATDVYRRLADGKTLDDAITEAREALFHMAERDWANYVLYGDGRFRLVARTEK